MIQSNTATRHQATPLLLMVVRYDRTVKQEIAYLRVCAKRVQSALNESDLCDAETDTFTRLKEKHAQRIIELKALPEAEMVAPSFSALRAGAGVAHPGRVIGFWANGTLTFEDGMQPLSSDELQDVLKTLTSRIWTYTESGLLDLGTTSSGVALNRAFTQ